MYGREHGILACRREMAARCATLAQEQMTLESVNIMHACAPETPHFSYSGKFSVWWLTQEFGRLFVRIRHVRKTERLASFRQRGPRIPRTMLKNADDYERLAQRAEERAAGRWPQSK
jgi:hypothetical protein